MYGCGEWCAEGVLKTVADGGFGRCNRGKMRKQGLGAGRGTLQWGRSRYRGMARAAVGAEVMCALASFGSRRMKNPVAGVGFECVP